MRVNSSNILHIHFYRSTYCENKVNLEDKFSEPIGTTHNNESFDKAKDFNSSKSSNDNSDSKRNGSRNWWRF